MDNYLTGILLRFSGNTVEYVNAGHNELLIKHADSLQSEIVAAEDQRTSVF